ncbi:MAG: ATP-binding cassette domain-containing protein [Oscillospiraceae bacterium]|nr:ATP-binding cassette domain-containing protein [Oscillospiraceae bacterium]
MIKSIEIVGLFGRFNYRIATMPGGITILTGPNGFGKSTILKIISALSTSDLMYFLQLEFKTITINFDRLNRKVRKQSLPHFFVSA